MHIDESGKIKSDTYDITAQPQKTTNKTINIFGEGFADKNGNEIIDVFDFDDETIIQKVEKAGLMGKQWKNNRENVNSLLEKTDVWTVQNNQSVSQIAIMVLKQTKPNYTKLDVDNMVEQLIQMNESKLDGTKKGFLVNAEIKLPFQIDISNEKQSENPVFDYVWSTQSKRISDIVAKYNLIDKNNIETTTYKDALELSNKFLEEYGYLDSTSREYLILSPHFDITDSTGEKLAAVRMNATVGSENQRLSSIDKNVRKYGAANCAECSDLLVKMGFEKFGNKYKIFEISFSPHDSSKDGHIAMLIKSEDGTEEYIIDPWISPKTGAIFKREDWEVMLKEVYNMEDSEKANISENYTKSYQLENEKLFYDSVKFLEKEIPSENLGSVEDFVQYVSCELRKGNPVYEKVIELYKHYSSSSYKEITEKQKDFYDNRDLIKKEVSEKASIYIEDFGDEVFNNLVNNKKYSSEIMNLFKRFCEVKYQNYLKILELRKYSDVIANAFPEEDIKVLTSSHEEFSIAVNKGLSEGKIYSDEIIDLYLKCNYYNEPDLKIKQTSSRIEKSHDNYTKFEKSFNKNMTPEILTNYLDNITDVQATLVTLEEHCEELITNIDQAEYGWGNRRNKKALILPLVDFVSKACEHLSQDDINEFRMRCMKELDATFYTNQKEIIKAFKKILEEANYCYKNSNYFDYTQWLQNK